MLSGYIPPETRVAILGWRLNAVRKVVKPIGRYPCNHSYPGHISLSGVLVDRIRAASTVWETPEDKLSSKERAFDMFGRIHRYISECESMHSELAELSSGDTPCLIADAFWKTLICGMDDPTLLPRYEYGKKFPVWRRMLRLADEGKSNGLDSYSREDLAEILLEVATIDL